jgi:hypothetical protein
VPAVDAFEQVLAWLGMVYDQPLIARHDRSTLVEVPPAAPWMALYWQHRA